MTRLTKVLKTIFHHRYEPTTESSTYMAQKTHYSASDVKRQPLIVLSLLMSQYPFPYLVILCIGNSEMTELCSTDRSLQTHYAVTHTKDWAILNISIKRKIHQCNFLSLL